MTGARLRVALLGVGMAVSSVVSTISPVPGFAAPGDGFVEVEVARLLDSRPGATTVDGRFAGTGLLGAGEHVAFDVRGRAGVPVGAEAAALTITTTGSTRAGYVSAFPCGQMPLASTLNHAGGENRANSLVVPLDAAGKVCLFSLAPTHLVVDVSGYAPSGSPYTPVTPARLADTRLDGVTLDGACAATGRVRGLTALDDPVAGRAGVPVAGVGAVVVNVALLAERRPGFVTMSEGGAPVPLASNGNFGAGEVVAAGAVVPVGADGSISLFVNTGVHTVVDVVGWFPGGSVASTRTGCDGTFVRPIGDIDSLDGNCAVKQVGTVVCWNDTIFSGGIIYGGPQTIAGLADVVEVNGQCARRRDGTITCFAYQPEAAIREELVFTRPAVDLSERCVITSDRRVECARASDGSVVAITLPAAPSSFLAEPGRYAPLGGPVRRLRTVDGSVLEISGDDAFAVTTSSGFGPGVPWSSVAAASVGDCAVLTGERVSCSGEAPRIAPDVIQNGRQFILRGDGQLEVQRYATPSGDFVMVDVLPVEELLFAEVLQTHPRKSPLICGVSTAAVLRCSLGADESDPSSFTIEGILLPE